MSDVPIAEQQMRHKRMMESEGAPWQCPQCPNGYQMYIIRTDMNICPFCGYKGGPVKKQTEQA
jgi:rubrerythrin